TGYRAFRAELMEEAVRAAAREGEHAFPADIEPTDPLATRVARLAAADARAVRDTVRLLDLAVLDESARVLSASARIVRAGLGASGVPATGLPCKVARLRLSAQALTSAHDALPAVTALGGRDCRLAVSDSGRTTDVLDAVEIDGGAGARV